MLGTCGYGTVKHMSTGKRTLRLWRRGMPGVTMAAVVCAASPSFGQTLESELAGLLLDHPQIKSSQKALESSRALIRQALAQFLPQVSLSSSIGPEVTDGPEQRNRGLERGAIVQTGITTTVTVTQGLFSGYSTASAVRTARLNKWL